MACIFRVAPAPLFFLLLLPLLAAESEYRDVVNNNGEKKTFFLFSPQDNDAKEDEEGINGSRHLFFCHHLQPPPFYSWNQLSAINHSTMASTYA